MEEHYDQREALHAISIRKDAPSGTRIYASVKAAEISDVLAMDEAELLARVSDTVKAVKRYTREIFLAPLETERFRLRMKRDSAEEHQAIVLARLQELGHDRKTIEST